VTHPLSLAAGVLPEFRADAVAEAAGRAGFPMVGFTVEPADWDDAMTRRVRDRVAHWGLDVLDVEVVWIPAGGAINDGHRKIVDVAAELGARNLLVVSSEADTVCTGAALRALCDRAAPAGIRVALEFLMLTPICTLAQALAAVRACDHPAAAVLVDSLHLHRGGDRPAALGEVDPARLPYAQFCDGRAECEHTHAGYLEDAVDLRSCPGEGALPLVDLLSFLPVDCPLSLEVRSRAVRRQFADPAERAAAVLARSRAFLEAHAGP
jgi:sugar phosphate isomerase/epimerase